jgi:phosphoribosylformylglycinamidine cyclo-ligase
VIFELIREASAATDDDLFSTFNMGLGMLIVAGPADAERIMDRKTDAVVAGRVVPGTGVRVL